MKEENAETVQKYDEILNEVREIVIAKNIDYGDSWRKMRITSITDQILVKAYRIRNLEESKEPPKISEGVEAEYKDIINYCIFALLKLREEDTSQEI
ncbi:MAG: DUF1599 domain-containing protein [Methanophagales archaeon]|nr:DUF1599 domain-containing protein [Methanophagales archaeon]